MKLTLAFGSAGVLVVFPLTTVFFTGSSKSLFSLSIRKSLSSESDMIRDVVNDRPKQEGTLLMSFRLLQSKSKASACRRSAEIDEKSRPGRIALERFAMRGIQDRETVPIPVELRQTFRMRCWS